MAFRLLASVPDGTPVVTLTVFRYLPKYRLWALSQMGRPAVDFKAVKGLQFAKLLGSGKDGFSIVPDFLQYALIVVWENAQMANDFFASAMMDTYRKRTDELWTVQLLTWQAHGKWDGQEPFASVNNFTLPPELPVVVLTRAAIRTRALVDFWQHVPQVNRRLQQANDLLFSVGVGELPIVQQATVSMWRNVQAMKDFAYGKPDHREVVRRTRERNWYKEDLFARFVPVATEGTYMGKDIFADYVKVER